MNPSVFAPKRGRFSFLSEVITPIDLIASFNVDKKSGVETADISMEAKQGSIGAFEKKLNFDTHQLKSKP